MRVSFIFILTALLVLSYAPHANAQALFNRTLKIGSSGEDVRQLQRILNSDAVTRIANSGPGSPGNETLYFDNLTRNAVIRFQEKYASQILRPNGLTAGTGVVEASTRAVLNTINNSWQSALKAAQSASISRTQTSVNSSNSSSGISSGVLLGGAALVAAGLIGVSSGIPFGGIITLIRPCLGGGLVLATIVQPPPFPPVEIAAAGSPFLFFMMSHPGQFVLGKMTNPTWCFTSPHTGFFVPYSFFYGTSL